MSRKIRTPKGRSDIPLTPAIKFFLMTGGWAPARLPGWFAAAQAGMFGHPTPAAVWEEWADVLTGEAASAGFAPSGIGSKRPRGDAVAQWAKQFLARHAY